MADADIAGRFVVDGRFVDDVANVRVSGGKLEFYNSDGTTRRTVYEAIRLGKGVTQADLTFRTGIDAGIILHYQDSENFMVALLDDNGSGTVTPRLAKYADGKKVDLLVSGSTFSLTDNTTYAVKCAVGDDAGNSALQELKLYVGGTLRLTTTAVDDTWSAGKVGFFRATNTSGTTLQWDNFKCGLDRSSPLDQDIDDAGTDWVYATCDFDDPGGSTWQKLTLTYDDNGNLTNDGLRQYRYDAWNRLRAATYANLDITDPNQWIADYRYYADTRRARKIVQNRGIETVANDGGDTVIDFYYDDQWRVVEERNGSNQAVRQYCFGTQYTDEIVFMDVNTEPSDTNDCDPDVDTGGERADERYFYHQDRNWNVVALTGYNTNPSDAANGAIVERYVYTTPYGEFVVLGGTTGSASSEAANARRCSGVGNAYAHQGLPTCFASRHHNSRKRALCAQNERFCTPDPIRFADGTNAYAAYRNAPTRLTDRYGLWTGYWCFLHARTCDELLSEALAAPGNSELYNAVASVGCAPQFKCGGPECDGNTGGSHAGDVITICPGVAGVGDTVRHELIHAWQKCPKNRIARRLRTNDPANIACWEFQAYLCDGKNHLPDMPDVPREIGAYLGCLSSLASWCAQGGNCPEKPDDYKNDGDVLALPATVLDWLEQQCDAAKDNPNCNACNGIPGMRK